MRKSVRPAPGALLALVLLLCAGAPAYALDLDRAKREGLVGETMEGYLAAVADRPSPEVADLVEEINARRRAEYRRIAEQHDIELSQVEALAAKKAIDKTEPGHWVRINGEWRRK